MTHGTALFLSAVDSRLVPLTGNKIPLSLAHGANAASGTGWLCASLPCGWQRQDEISGTRSPKAVVLAEPGFVNSRVSSGLEGKLGLQSWGAHVKVRLTAEVRVKCGVQCAPDLPVSATELESPCFLAQDVLRAPGS